MLKTAVTHLNNIMTYRSSKIKKVARKRIVYHCTWIALLKMKQ